MATVALGIGTNPFPDITDDIQIAIYDASDPAAVVTSQQNVAPHPQRAWNFPGLPIANYIFRIFQMIGSTTVVRQQLGGDMEVVPGAQVEVTYWEDEQITADTTLGFSSGVNTVVFDGTGGKEDWRGRDIATLVRMGGEGVMKKGVDYSWNINTGALLLLVAGDVFNAAEWFNVTFGLLISTVTSSVPTILPPFMTPKVITAYYVINAGTDFGGLLIIRPPASGTPSDNLVILQLPLIATVPAGKLLNLEMARSTVQQCAQIVCQAGEYIDWLLGNQSSLFMCNQESISIYKFIDTIGGAPVSVWRVYNPYGNWLKVGEQVVDDNNPVNVFNKILLSGQSLDIGQYGRLYNQFVLNLPPGETCNYDDWATGNNKYLYSLANSSNPLYAGQFMTPNRLNTFERITDGTRLPGNFQAQTVPAHNHPNGVADDTAGVHPYSLSVYGRVATDMPGFSTGQPDIVGSATASQGITATTGSADGHPANIAVRKYLLV